MLPKSMYQEHLFRIPKFRRLKRSEIDFSNELKGFHQLFHGCFHRSESRKHFFRYMAGQLSHLEGKLKGDAATASNLANTRSIQRFISDTEWDDQAIILKYRSILKEDMGCSHGVLIIDETDFVKKGYESIGVANQYCVRTGKVENSQVGVFAAYASSEGYCLLEKQLFLPELWFTDDYRERRNKCKLPGEITFKTKPQLAVKMLEEIIREAILPIRYVTAGSLYGDNHEFIQAIEAIPQVIYFTETDPTTRCWVDQSPDLNKKGRNKLKESYSKPVDVQTVAGNINDFFWYRRKVVEGTKGVFEYEFTKLAVAISHDNISQKPVWLIVRRSIGKNPDYNFFLSNAAGNSRLELFVWLSGIRWASQQCFEETRTQLTMDRYEVRKYSGWNHHMLTCMLAHFFLWHLNIRRGKKSTVHYGITD